MDVRALAKLRERHGRVYAKGRVIFHDGDVGGEFYVILSGAVEVTKERSTSGEPPERYVLARLHPGSVFGEMGAFTGEPRSATALAVEDTALLYFDQHTAVQLLMANPQFGLDIIRTLAQRLRVQNERTMAMQATVRRLVQRRGRASPPGSPPG